MTVTARFAGKTAIVTGAGSGIGRATAVRLASEGARVVATDVVKARLDQLVVEFPALGLTAVVAELAEAAGLEAVLAAAGQRVDVLANVAGIMDGFLPAAEVDDATWKRVLDVNLTAPMRLSRAVLQLMLAAGRGSIVNVASAAGLRGGAAGAAYTASKHALIGLTRSTAVTYGPLGIRCNAVAPGPVKTNIEAPFRSELAARRLQPLLGAVMSVVPTASPEQLAAVIAFLASDEAANVNGAVLASDGGWSAI
jgi:NAD(P)-dependent dehydrogenase (short-subunit alcohol dehydrogenase family)